MAIPTALELYEAAESAIMAILTGQKQSASFAGKSYTALSLSDLEKVRDYYRQQAINRGELSVPTNQRKVSVSFANIKDF